jgi:hypothetical protein
MICTHFIKSRPVIKAILGLLVITALGSCGDEKALKPAPLGEHATLEKLAQSYRQVSANLPTSPTGLTPEGRRKFLEQVFHQAGYDYSATLIALAKVPPADINQNHIDLKQLLYLPHYDKRLKQLSDLYSEEEIAAIKAIDKNIN